MTVLSDLPGEVLDRLDRGEALVAGTAMGIATEYSVIADHCNTPDRVEWWLVVSGGGPVQAPKVVAHMHARDGDYVTMLRAMLALMVSIATDEVAAEMA